MKIKMKKIITFLLIIITIYPDSKEDIIKEIENAFTERLIKNNITTVDDVKDALKNYFNNKNKRQYAISWCQKQGITDEKECLKDYYGVAINRILEKKKNNKTISNSRLKIQMYKIIKLIEDEKSKRH